MYKIGWFSTGRDEAACNLFRSTMDKIQNGYIPDAEVSFVFSNREPGESGMTDRFFKLVKGYDVDMVCSSHRRFRPSLRRRGVGRV